MSKKTSRIHAYQRIPIGIKTPNRDSNREYQGKNKKKYGRKVLTHSKLQKDAKKLEKVPRKCKKHTLDHTRECKLINARLLMHAYYRLPTQSGRFASFAVAFPSSPMT